MRKREGLDEIGPKGRSQLLSSNACQKNETTLNTRVDTDDAYKNECVSAREAFQEDVLGGINADRSDQILVGKRSTRSTCVRDL